MKKILIVIILSMALSGGNVLADNHDNNEVGAGITPSSFFYFLDRLVEKVQSTSIRDTKKKMDFAFELLKERTAEIKAIRKEKGDGYTSSEEYETAVALRNYHIREIGQYIRTLEVEEALKLREKFEKAAYESQKYLVQDLFAISVKKKELRNEINASRKADDAIRAESLLVELQREKERYEHLAKLAAWSTTIMDIEAEKIEDMLGENVGREVILKKADALHKDITGCGLDELRCTRIYIPDDEEGPSFTYRVALERIHRVVKALKKFELGDLPKKEFEKAAAKLEKLAKNETKRLGDLEEKAKSLEEKELDNKLAEEKEARHKARFPSPELPPQKKPTEPAKQPAPRPLGQPTQESLASPITFNPLLNFQSKVGEKFEYSFCQPPVARTSDLCTAASTNPTGGKPPYYFQLGLDGFPPFGITLNLNGLLAGTPSSAGSRTFSVCAVDLAGKSTCSNITITVKEKDLEEPYVPRQGCAPQSEVPKPPSGCTYEFLRCNENTYWVWEYRFNCPEQTGTNCWVEREQCSKKNDDERVTCYNSCPNTESSARTQCTLDCTAKSNEQQAICNAIPCQ